MPEIVIASIRGPILELRHPPDVELGIFDRLVGEAGIGATVALRAGSRSWAIGDIDHASLTAGQPVTKGEPEVVPLTPERLIEVGVVLSDTSALDRPRVCETGVKVIDVLTPMLEGGVTWLLGGPYLGRMQLLDELHRRLARARIPQTLVFPITPGGVATAAHNLTQRPDSPYFAQGALDTVWLVTEHVDNRTLAELDVIGTSRIFCGPRMPARGYWPAIDLLASRSTALARGMVEAAHVDLAMAILETLSWSERVRADAEFDRLADARDFRTAVFRTIELGILRLEQLDEASLARLQLAERLENFFAQSLHVDEVTSGRVGTHVPMHESLIGCRAILAGRIPPVGFDYPARLGS
ncbi:hypothetical protein ACNOYE_12890 [Nannocystaceae bacterium ST9]